MVTGTTGTKSQEAQESHGKCPRSLMQPWKWQGLSVLPSFPFLSPAVLALRGGAGGEGASVEGGGTHGR